MNALRPILAWILAAGSMAFGQSGAPPADAAPDSVPLSGTDFARRSAAELEQLVAPIALYPDALIALILPAATVPADIVLAARQLRETGNDRSQIEHRAWDESVKSLTNYPEVIKWMDENLQWTKQLGEAFAEQPVEVMQAVQRLRAKARADGTLVDTPQQQVLSDLEVIRIVPAQANAIYVPSYDPALIFLPEPVAYGRPWIQFGVGLPVGSWLAFECDWRRHTIWMGNRHRHWSGHDWHRPVVPIPVAAPAYARHPEVRPWRPPTLPSRYGRPLPPQSPPEFARIHPAPASGPRPESPRAPLYRPVPPRREPPNTVPAANPAPGPVSPNLAPALATAPFARVPATTPVVQTPSTPPTYENRRTPAAGEREPGRSAPGYDNPRRRPPESRPAPPATTTAVVAPPPSTPPRHSGRTVAPAPPPSSSPPPARSTPPPQARPAPPPASPSAPAPASAPARTEVESERTVGRRTINEK